MPIYEQLNRLTKVDLKLYEGQLRLRAPRLGQALGFQRYDDTRKIIERRRDELERPAYGGPLAQIVPKSTGGRPGSVWLLTITQAMLVAMFSDAPNAPDVREQIILAANAWYQDHPESLPFFNALLAPEPLKTEGNVTWLPPEQISDEEDAKPELDECERRELAHEQERSQQTAARLRQIGIDGIQGRLPFDLPLAEKVNNDDDGTVKPHPSEWSASYQEWRKDICERLLPRPVGRQTTERYDANQHFLDCITNKGHTPQGYGDSTYDTPTMFMRDELPLGHSADSWRVWVSEQWFRLPLELRQRWWRDTDYGNRTPSTEMIDAIIAISLP